MENYIGKNCPFCKTEIKEGEPVKVCPDCGIPHHQSCWEENGGCTTFGCSAKYHAIQETPSNICSHCGAMLSTEQEYCSNCGTAKISAKKNTCTCCGAELQEGQKHCSTCGQKIEITANVQTNSAINQYNTTIGKKKKKKTKILLIVITAILICCIGFGIGIFNIISNQNAIKIKDEYIKNVDDFLSLSYEAGNNLEDITNTIQDYWYENIVDDKHGADIDEAVHNATLDKSNEITQAKIYDNQLNSLYSKIKNIPDGISKEDVDDLEEICDAVKDLYDIYTDFYILATDPSGSYTSYSGDNSETSNEFFSCYHALKNLVK